MPQPKHEEVSAYLLEHFGLTENQKLVDSWIELAGRSDMDIMLELTKARAWAISGKGYKDYKRYLTNWILRAAKPKAFTPEFEDEFFKEKPCRQTRTKS